MINKKVNGLPSKSLLGKVTAGAMIAIAVLLWQSASAQNSVANNGEKVNNNSFVISPIAGAWLDFHSWAYNIGDAYVGGGLEWRINDNQWWTPDEAAVMAGVTLPAIGSNDPYGRESNKGRTLKGSVLRDLTQKWKAGIWASFSDIKESRNGDFKSVPQASTNSIWSVGPEVKFDISKNLALNGSYEISNFAIQNEIGGTFTVGVIYKPF